MVPSPLARGPGPHYTGGMTPPNKALLAALLFALSGVAAAASSEDVARIDKRLQEIKAARGQIENTPSEFAGVMLTMGFEDDATIENPNQTAALKVIEERRGSLASKLDRVGTMLAGYQRDINKISADEAGLRTYAEVQIFVLQEELDLTKFRLGDADQDAQDARRAPSFDGQKIIARKLLLLDKMEASLKIRRRFALGQDPRVPENPAAAAAKP
jgi:hypothetical protein